MGEYDISDRGREVYNEARNGKIKVKPLHTTISNIDNLKGSVDLLYRVIARELLQHAHDYKEQLVITRVKRSDRHNEEGPLLASRFMKLEDRIRDDGFEATWYDAMTRDLSADLQDESASYFWPAIQAIFTAHPKYLKNNMFLTQFGNAMFQDIVLKKPLFTKPTEVNLLTEYKFNAPVFQTIRHEMRKIERALLASK